MRPQSHAGIEISTPSALLAEGLKRHATGNFAAAARCYQQALDHSPRNPDALLLLGIIARHALLFKEAIALTKAAIEERPAAHYFLNLAHAHRAAGNLAEAERACRKALALAPRDAATHCWLAEILLEVQSYDAARRCCEEALAVQPGFGRAHHGIGNILCKQGDHTGAAASYRRAVALDPRRAEFHFGLGYALQKLDERREARAAFLAALKLRPSFVEAHLNLGNLYYDRGQFPAAAAHYQFALRIRPGYVKAWVNLGNALSRLSRITEAIACYRRALQLKPDSAKAQHGLGNAFAAKKQWVQAHECLLQAIELNPASAEFHNSLGNLHYSQKQPHDAAVHYRRAIEIDSTYARAHVNLGNALLALGKHEQARSMYERGLALDRASPGALYNLALARLRNAEFAQGWRDYESRWDFEELHLRRRNFRVPQWRGEALNGKTILLHAEQGLGDTVQFARFVPLVAARGGRVILEVQQPLVRLLQQLPGVERIIPHGAALPACDFHCPLMSLPLALGTTVDTIPSAEGYLTAEPTLQFPADAKILRVGIAWSGNPRHKADATRSMPLESLIPLAGIPGLQLISLQKGAGIEQLAPLRDRLPLLDAASTHADMHETAALIGTLDLVLSVDTSIAHLSGAMAKPVWIMLPWVADWRWMEQRADCPWYRSARLFRQSAAGDWASVVEEIVVMLNVVVDLKSQKRYTMPPAMIG
jgi:tetratricopeptide (TPR) repeat protein